ncbi:GDP-L-fucose synthase family protein [Roseobacter sp. CCS2]|uniref:GDP-L-fucose synthase family protein n=1 Tax=Roseobacter sp. CCS2 TaxID=391593 RepID=UPI0000F3F125|nr:GDP-L-fucose synthase [Roseobacter sp. CCS2]EBA11289.1 putative nucleotide di-P-sugar epimerase or dehydratase [Roseobacter sp. CCS2]
MRIFLAGHNGMVGSAILRKLVATRDHDVITVAHAALDLTNQAAVRSFVWAKKPDLVIIAAAKVGGIMANDTKPADFIQDNLMIASNLIQEAHAAGVQRLIQLGSSCIYPRDTAQPIPESALMTGPLEPTNEPYAMAKIAAIKLCESYNRQYGRDYRSLMPTNLYGPGDNFHPDHSHVLPSLLRRYDDAVRSAQRAVTIWGTGAPRREFLHVDDLADAVLFTMGLSQDQYAAATRPMQSHLNVGTGKDISILKLAHMVADLTGFCRDTHTDPSKPDGTPRKLLDTSVMQSLGWAPKISLHDGLAQTYDWYRTMQEAGQNLRAS